MEAGSGFVFLRVEDFVAIPLVQVIGDEFFASDQNDRLNAAKLIEYPITDVVSDPASIPFAVLVEHGFEINFITCG